MVNKHKKKFLTSFIIRIMQIKIYNAVSPHVNQSMDIVKIFKKIKKIKKNLQAINFRQDVMKIEPCCTGWKCKLMQNYEEQYGTFLKRRINLLYYPVITTVYILRKSNSRRCSCSVIVVSFAVLFTISRIQKQLSCPVINQKE